VYFSLLRFSHVGKLVAVFGHANHPMIMVGVKSLNWGRFDYLDR
jgi:rRNA processing protein Gar1